ncbi:putative palmitoyltransferase AKR2 NDAI_0F00830 [Naumovozyma dairenensis CBS 421]|uniref:Uncharacterized protein n=1 Tax=Naumovozyma dairenensis (strain ATCC 10597 / BCRC 20456 / CBS 421 / NBRC 0211 / NRRL Y-12639) TaxID=1071378 RepID=G0WC91_NAUDC|nr:hypothetical protein NDAI_0F00830 [Naumovozyma dairenensis CBS 421]CCD25402.1 hypothetical protein NDAI_0F00830 [Naumovozyma dairenensis CBS 421]
MENITCQAFLTACQGGDLNKVRKFLSQNCDENDILNIQDEYHKLNPLQWAIINKRITIIKLLLGQKKCPISVNDPRMEASGTPLYWAIRYGYVDITNFLLLRGARFHDSLLHTAIKNSHLLMVIYLVSNQSVQCDINSQDSRGNTVLHWSCFQNDPLTVKFLLKFGADANIRNNLGQLPVHFAIQRGNSEILNSLIKHGTDLNVSKETNTEHNFISFSEKMGTSIIFKEVLGKKLTQMKTVKEVLNICSLYRALKRKVIGFLVPWTLIVYIQLVLLLNSRRIFIFSMIPILSSFKKISQFDADKTIRFSLLKGNFIGSIVLSAVILVLVFPHLSSSRNTYLLIGLIVIVNFFLSALLYARIKEKYEIEANLNAIELTVKQLLKSQQLDTEHFSTETYKYRLNTPVTTDPFIGDTPVISERILTKSNAQSIVINVLAIIALTLTMNIAYTIYEKNRQFLASLLPWKDCLNETFLKSSLIVLCFEFIFLLKLLTSRFIQRRRSSHSKSKETSVSSMV